ncbi:hypothetical protein [Bacillus sp. MUM 13]|uniref:hypothetical protein n=1 Tax=Bacillus sp. MUM 13 TaxID=1678001 RepID=UPI00147CB631|nr:hypothetical protein [Bacillus sp. MUM 13]
MDKKVQPQSPLTHMAQKNYYIYPKNSFSLKMEKGTWGNFIFKIHESYIIGIKALTIHN